MVVLVVDHGQIVQNAAFGVRNLATKAPVDTDTRFEIGSITKQFTAAAILQLKEQRKLSLDDTLGKYIPQYAPGANITLRQMLLQISGIPSYTDVPGFAKMISITQSGTYTISQPGSIEGVLGLIKNMPLDFASGTKWEYSNSNYYLLGHIVEIVSGQTWSSYISENIFKPAGMTQSSFIENEASIPDMATGYALVKNNLMPVASFNGWAWGAGRIVSQAGDLAKCDAALVAGKIISPQDLALMTAPGTLPAGRLGHYGFGWVVDSYDSQPRIWHNGATLGFNATNQLYPSSQQAVIVLTNFGGGADQIADNTFDGLHPDLAAAAKAADAAAAKISAPGEDPAVTARAKSIWNQFITGKLDRSQLSDSTNAALTPEVVAGTRAQFASLGSATSWTYRGKQAAGEITNYVYRVAFTSGTVLNIIMSVDGSGKIAGYLAQPSS